VRSSFAALVLCLGIVAGCSQQSVTSQLPAPSQGATAAGFTSFYSFGALPDGHRPFAALVAVSDELYGTTLEGGSGDCKNTGGVVIGCGTIFEINTSGKERVLYSFKGAPDGARPLAELLIVNGKLYGTTADGGAEGFGTVFELDRSTGSEHVLYSFTHDDDGAYPSSGLIDVKGMLYGVTRAGGAVGGCPRLRRCGTVYAVNPSSREVRIVHRFEGPPADGSSPMGRLLAVRGALYGTTSDGGTSDCKCGTIFSVNLSSDKERVVYSFKSGKDGASPMGSLLALGGALYGTTANGGDASVECNGSDGCGTVFVLRHYSTSSARQRVLYSFKGQMDGGYPTTGLTAINGALYGTTSIGGSERNGGTLFEVSRSGAQRVLHSFGGSDGAHPDASLIDVSGVLYGTTSGGGAYRHGTLFKITP
jgi:uncharacterized repeat protein (TIGR03803 family)